MIYKIYVCIYTYLCYYAIKCIFVLVTFKKMLCFPLKKKSKKERKKEPNNKMPISSQRNCTKWSCFSSTRYFIQVLSNIPTLYTSSSNTIFVAFYLLSTFVNIFRIIDFPSSICGSALHDPHPSFLLIHWATLWLWTKPLNVKLFKFAIARKSTVKNK